MFLLESTIFVVLGRSGDFLLLPALVDFCCDLRCFLLEPMNGFVGTCFFAATDREVVVDGERRRQGGEHRRQGKRTRATGELTRVWEEHVRHARGHAPWRPCFWNEAMVGGKG